MSSAEPQPNLVLTRRSAAGGIELDTLDIPQQNTVTRGSAYALIDRESGFRAPEKLSARRLGDDLVLTVDGAEVLVLQDFFTTPDVSFHPAPDLAGGGGPFSGVPLTPDSPAVGKTAEGIMVVWTAEPLPEDPGSRPDSEVDSERDGGINPLVWGGVALAGIGLAAAAGGGGGGGGGESVNPPSGTGGSGPSDTTAPVFTSGATADSIDENSAAGSVVYRASATDAGTVTYSLAGPDAAAFDIDGASGVVTLLASPDFEIKSSYDFTVVARNTAGNSSQRTVRLNIGNVDEVAPTITSASIATAIDENSGSDQVVYTVASTDDGDISSGATRYSLDSAGDSDKFRIDAVTGAVTLTENPDFESQPGYTFRVVATDPAGNSSERDVTLAINDVDETGPVVAGIGLRAAVGAQDGLLNAGDTVRVAVTFNEEILVDTSGGTPRVALDLGGTEVFATFVGGNATSDLTFEYVIQAGDTDADGIGIPGNALASNGATLTDAAGNEADLSNDPVPDDSAFLVDTSAPVLTASSPVDDAEGVPLDSSIVLTFSEDVFAGSGALTISDGEEARTFSINDASQVSIDNNRVTIDPSTDLNPGRSYSVRIDAGALLDAAGNPYAGIEDATELNFATEVPVDTTVVVFDMVQGVSSDHSGRTFVADVSYDIYIRVDSDRSDLSRDGDGPGRWGRWAGAENLGSDDRVILVGDGAPIEGALEPVSRITVDDSSVRWVTAAFGDAAAELQGETLTRATGFRDRNSDDERLFRSDLPASFLAGQGGLLSTMYLTTMPVGILTSQGLV